MAVCTSWFIVCGCSGDYICTLNSSQLTLSGIMLLSLWCRTRRTVYFISPSHFLWYCHIFYFCICYVYVYVNRLFLPMAYFYVCCHMYCFFLHFISTCISIIYGYRSKQLFFKEIEKQEKKYFMLPTYLSFLSSSSLCVDPSFYLVSFPWRTSSNTSFRACLLMKYPLSIHFSENLYFIFIFEICFFCI